MYYLKKKIAHIHITLSHVHSHMFWSDAGNPRLGVSGKIERADMDGNNRRAIVTSLVGSPRSVAVYNPTGFGGRIYWTDQFNGVIDTTDLHGNDRFNLISECVKEKTLLSEI